MKEGFVFFAWRPWSELLGDQWHTAEGIISLGWLMMASIHRCLSCLSWGCFGVRLILAPLPLALTTCGHLRWAAFFPQRHEVSDTVECAGKPLCLVLMPWETDGGERHSVVVQELVERQALWRSGTKNKCESNCYAHYFYNLNMKDCDLH